MDLFSDLKLPKEKLHDKFVRLRDSVQFDGQRKVLQSWAEGFVDRDNKFVFQFQTTFHSCFWELYLHQLFKDLNFEIDFSKKAPDFVITNPVELYVEAVTANIKKEGRKEQTRDHTDIAKNLDPPHLQDDFYTHLDEAITRYSSALQNKVQKVNNDYRRLLTYNPQVPFLLAVGSYSQVNYGREFCYPMMALLYGLYFNPYLRDYDSKEFIVKPGTSSTIKLNLFDDPDMNSISAILFSCTVTHGKLTSLSLSLNNSIANFNSVFVIREEPEPPHYWFQEVGPEDPEWHSDGLFIFHNPNATVKLPTLIFEKTGATQVVFDDEGLRMISNRMPIYSRVDLPKIMIQGVYKKLLIETSFERLNSNPSLRSKGNFDREGGSW